ncbi:MAG TPA: T9SS type A sorting domain-containing protein [Saprospiraceae bacterium]|nr:T9SS type A sorting domain-containing protein [Saprospiraceae bacterium]
MKYLYPFIIILLFSFFAKAQDECGTNRAEAIQRILASKSLIQKHPDGFPEDERYVPIKFHLVADSEGQQRVTEHKVFEALCRVNQEFANTGFTFYIKDGFDYMDNSAVFDYNHTSALTTNSCRQAFDSTAVNIFIVHDILNPTGSSGIIYSHPDDWLIMKNSSYFAPLSRTSHGLGHFFSLMNTTSDHIEIDTSSTCAQNCENVADFICDTPPDYNVLGPLGADDCTYTGTDQDSCGTPIHPMTNNAMGYWMCPLFAFTPEQSMVMQADYAKPSRAYLQSNYIPNTTPINQAPTLISPANSTTLSSNYVTLDWNDVPNASTYFLEVSRHSNFSQLTQTFITTQSEYVLALPEPNKNYFWRVTPFNDGYTCSDSLTSMKWTFITGPLALSEIDEISDWSIQPNPITSTVRLTLNVNRPINLNLDILSANGQLLYTEKHRLAANQQQIELANKQLKSGLYFLKITSKAGVEIRRFVVK